MMNRHITQWHNPRDCSAACTRVENVMNQLKTLVKSIEEEEDGYRPGKKEEVTQSLNQQELPCQPMPPHYRYPEPAPPPNHCCGKRNGLQDYCGVLGDCYMNPKAVVSQFGSRGMGTYPYQDERNLLRCEDHTGAHAGSAPSGQRDVCHGKDCINDFYLIPLEPHQ